MKGSKIIKLMAALLVIAVVFSCSRQTKTDSGESNDRENVDIQEFDIESAELMAAFRRTGCFGHCPIFRVRFYRGGVASFQGELYVEPMGMHLGEFDEAKMKSLIREATDMGFFEMADQYPIDEGYYIPDLSNTITTLVRNDLKKTVDHNNKGPEELEYLEQSLQEMIDAIDWIPDNKRGTTR